MRFYARLPRAIADLFRVRKRYVPLSSLNRARERVSSDNFHSPRRARAFAVHYRRAAMIFMKLVLIFYVPPPSLRRYARNNIARQRKCTRKSDPRVRVRARNVPLLCARNCATRKTYRSATTLLRALIDRGTFQSPFLRPIMLWRTADPSRITRYVNFARRMRCVVSKELN